MLAPHQQMRVADMQASTSWPWASVACLFSHQAAARPAATAVVYRDRALTYAELDRLSDRVSDQLLERGVGPDVLIGLCVERSERLLIALLGILKSGGAYLPFEPEWPHARVRHMLSDAKPSFILSDRSFMARFEGCGIGIMPLNADMNGPGLRRRAQAPSPLLPDHLAYVMFTSGSTGRPKGVMITQGALSTFLASMAERPGLHESDIVVAVTPFTFDIAALELILPLLRGGTVVVADRVVSRDGEALQRLLSQSRATILQATPATWRILVAAGWRPRPGLRMFCGGEALTHDLASTLTASGNVLWNLYGPTETTIWSSAGQVKPGGPVSLGDAVEGARVHVLDDRLSPCTPGEIGEIYIGGGCVARGYVGRPDLTAARFLPDPFGTGTRLYRTGDLARVGADGGLEFVGRSDRQIKLRGYRIELDEIESVLEAQANVQQAAVTLCGRDTDTLHLVGYVTPDRRRLRSSAAYRQARAEAVELWETIFDNVYSAETGAHGPRFAGLDSSYTRRPLPLPEQQEWLRSTVERLRGSRLGHVLEIGCGQGLLLQELAPHSLSYRGADPSRAAITALKQWISGQAQFRHVDLLHRPATRLDDIAHESIDTIIVNSVIQYFPDVEYLIEVLRHAAPLLAPGGRLFIGDVRHLGLLPLFHTSVQLCRSAAALTMGEFKERCARAMAAEAELAVDPRFFGAGPSLLKDVGEARILLKRGVSDNEMTRYRYDVLLSTGDGRAAPPAVPVDWQPATGWAAELDDMLSRRACGHIEIRNVPNRRLTKDIGARNIVEASSENRLVEDVRREVEALPAVGGDPEAFYAVGERHGYEVCVSWSPGCADGRFDVQFWHASQGRGPVLPTTPAGACRQDWEDCATNPILNALARQTGPVIREALKPSLPDYMIPTAIVVLDHMPVTSNGKVDRKALAASKTLGAEVEADLLTPTEEMLASFWRELLQGRQINRDDNFISLGGHSLLAMQMISRIRAAYGIELPLRTVFETPTLGELAAHLEDLKARAPETGPSPAMPRSPGRAIPLSYAQQEIWFVEQLGVAGPAYNMPVVIELRGPLDCEALLKAFEQLLSRHEILRTRIVTNAGRPCQQIDGSPDVRMAVEDLSVLTGPQKDQRRDQIVEELSRREFDLSASPLFRAGLIRLGDREHLLLIVLHHMISDEWSNDILVRELLAMYRAVVRGQAPQLPPSPLQYADYAIGQRESHPAAGDEQRLAYWKRKLKGVPDYLALPTDFARPAAHSYQGGNIRFLVSGEVCDRLKALGRAENATFFMVLLATFQWLLARWSGQTDIVIGTPSAQRDSIELETSLGLFVETLPMRTNLQEARSFVELLRSVRATAMEAYDHAVPFSQLLEALRPARSPAFQPIFQVWMAMQNLPYQQDDVDDLAIRWRNQETATAKFDLSLHVYERDSDIEMEFEYSTALFSRKAIEALSSKFAALLEAAASDPGALLSLAQSSEIAPSRPESAPSPPNVRLDPIVRPGATEKAILEVWEEVLNIPTAGPLDNFFDIGGSSIGLVAVREKLEHRLQRPIQILQMFMHPTARALAAQLGGMNDHFKADDIHNRALKQRRALALRRPIAVGRMV